MGIVNIVNISCVKSNRDVGTIGFLVSTSFRKWNISRYILGKLKLLTQEFCRIYIQAKFLQCFLAIYYSIVT